MFQIRLIIISPMSFNEEVVQHIGRDGGGGGRMFLPGGSDASI